MTRPRTTRSFFPTPKGPLVTRPFQRTVTQHHRGGFATTHRKRRRNEGQRPTEEPKDGTKDAAGMDSQATRETLVKRETGKTDASRANVKWLIKSLVIVLVLGAILILGQPVYWKLVANVKPLRKSTMTMARKQLGEPNAQTNA